MTKPNDGGPAYPALPQTVVKLDGNNVLTLKVDRPAGMSMRQAYKLAAMQGLATRSGYQNWRDLVEDSCTLAEVQLAEDAEFTERERTK